MNEERKKVGIMTWYQHRNYGTTLQAFALIEAIKGLGFLPEGINYVSEGYNRETKLEKLLSFRKLKEKIKRHIEKVKFPKPNNQIKEIRYERFLSDHIPMYAEKTQTESELLKLNNVFDAFVTGSDQIWTPIAYNLKYYLDFVLDSKKKIAYAPSFGVNDITNKYVKRDIGKHLKSFQALSVREKQGAKIIKEYSGLDAKVVLDPVLLFDSTFWKKYENKINLPENSIVCYILGENETTWRRIKNIAKKNRLRVVVIPVHDKDYTREFDIIKGVGPSEFLYLFSHASMVCTDSFHGIIFSILNHKNFIAFKRFSDKDSSSQNSRVFDLLNMLDLTAHLWNKKDEYPRFNWEDIDAVLTKKREESIRFLQNALHVAVSSEFKSEKIITNTCCGCGICSKICPNNAISMKLLNGFYQAQIDQKLCTKCGLCNKVCPFNGEVGRNLAFAKFYEAKLEDKPVFATSARKGIFSEKLSRISKDGFPFYVCELNCEKSVVKYILLEAFDSNKIQMYQGRMYLQRLFYGSNSVILNIWKSIIVGTPCQIAAIDNYLRIKGKREDFLLIDFVCPGVPSYNLWNKYIEDKKVDKHEIINIEFKYQRKSKGKKYLCMRTKQKEIIEKEEKSIFFKFFNIQACCMRSCYECNYRVTSNADIRLGDYNKQNYSKNDLQYKVRNVFCITRQGDYFIKKIQKEGEINILEKGNEDYCIDQYNDNPIIPLYYDDLIRDLENKHVSLKHLLYKYCYKQYLNRKLQLKIRNIKRN